MKKRLEDKKNLEFTLKGTLMNQNNSARILATIGSIGRVRNLLNDAMNKGYRIYYQEQGGFLEKMFTIKGDLDDIRTVYKHISQYFTR